MTRDAITTFTIQSPRLVMRTILAFLIAFAFLGATEKSAFSDDKKTIALVRFTGPHAKFFQKRVIRILRKGVVLLPASKYRKAAKRLRASRVTEDNIAMVAANLNADGVLMGTVKKRKRRYYLTLTLHSGLSGEAVKTLKVITWSLGLGKRETRKIKRSIFLAVKNLPSVEITMDEDELEEESTESASTTNSVETTPTVESSASVLSDEDIATTPRIVFAAGFNGSMRRLYFNYKEELNTRPSGYEGAIVPGVYVNAEIYPMAFGKKKGAFLAGIGLIATVDKVISISSSYTAPNSNGNVITLPTDQTKWGVGLVVNKRLGSKLSSPVIKVRALFRRLNFTIDRSNLDPTVDIDIPNFDYTYWDVGLGFRLPFSNKFALSFDGGALIITESGEVQSGEHYGEGTVFGISAIGEIEYRIKTRILFRTGASYTRIAFDFSGVGDRSNNRDNNPDQDVFGAVDQYLSFHGTLAYLF